jgi:hypothetical protein
MVTILCHYIERPAILNRSMPSTEGSTMSIPADPSVRQSLDEKRNLQVWEKVYLMESGFSRKFCPSAQD